MDWQTKSVNQKKYNHCFNLKKLRTFCGSPITIAPEMFDSKQGHSFEVDYWAIGIILYYMVYGKYPFESKNDDIDEIYDLIKNQEPDYDYENISTNTNDFIK